MRPVQYFSKEYLEQCRGMTPDQILQFLDDFRQLHGGRKSQKSRLISLKVPEDLLSAFRTKARLSGVLYQSQIKQLMALWVKEK